MPEAKTPLTTLCLALFAAAGLGAEALVSNLSSPASSGDPAKLLYGKPCVWDGGAGKPASISFDLEIPDGELDAVEISSSSPNKWFQTSRAALSGLKDGKAVKLDAKDWATRLEGEDEGFKRSSVSLAAKDGFKAYRLSVSRPHGFINLRVDGVKLVYKNQITAKAACFRSAFSPGQLCSGSLELEGNCPESLELEARLLKRGPDGEKEILSKRVSAGAGKASFEFSFPVDAPGEFSLVPELKALSKSYFAPYLRSFPAALEAFPQHSKYWMPIGTAHGSAQSAALGFRVRHDWGSPGRLSDAELKNSLDEGLVRSNCNVGFEHPEPDSFMVNAEGETLKIPSFQAPRKLSEESVEAFKRLNGHPGLFEVVYYNEHGYHTWHVKGLCDYNPRTLAAYRKWLEAKHGSLAAVNALQKAQWKSFAEIEPPKRFNGPDAAWFDWMEFRRQSFADYLKEAYSLIKPQLPDVRITPKPINFDFYIASTANDPWLYRDACDVFGYDLYPFQREGYLDPALSLDYHRTQVGAKDIHFLESNFEFARPNLTEKRAEDMLLLYWPAFLRGLKGAYFYCWTQPWSKSHSGFWLLGEDGALTPQGKGAALVAKGVQTLAPALKGSAPLGVRTAIYFPWEEISQTPNTAPVNALYGAYKLISQLHHPADVVSFHNVLQGDLAKYKVLVLPFARHLNPDVAAEIEDFVEKGGLLVSDLGCGAFDQYHRPSGALDKVLGIKRLEKERLDSSDEGLGFKLKDGSSVKLFRPISKESPFGWKHKPNIAPIQAAEKILAEPGAEVAGSFPDGSPAVVLNRYGKGASLYIAGAFFNSYRNYFYTRCTAPYPATRGNEIINVGNRESRKLVKSFLLENKISPPADVELYNDDVEEDESPYQLLSYYGNAHCAVFGVSNWGPHSPSKVKAWLDLPFEKVSKLYLFDTAGDSIRELPFKLEGGRLTATVPWLRATQLLIAVNDRGPLLGFASQDSDGGPVALRVVNHLPETAAGSAQVRIDGRVEALSEAVPFKIAPGAEAKFSLPLKNSVDPKLLLDSRGEQLPWYVWLTYDGDAVSFAKVDASGSLLAPR